MSFPRQTLGYSTPESLDETEDQYFQSTWHSSGSSFAVLPTQTIPDWQLESAPASFGILDPRMHLMPEYPPIAPQSRTVDHRIIPSRGDPATSREINGTGSAYERHDEYSLAPLRAQRPPFDTNRPTSEAKAHAQHATQDHVTHTTAEPNARLPQTRKSSRTDRFECDWPGCRYPGSFGRNTELQRHIRTLHQLPKSYKCPASGCSVSCNREDNLKSHQRNIHGWKV
ncbi:uncharacterized protein N7483_012598 [Penicillium malachiteum]|uniref:uncharacterized protein n=1 Tax=Penicillium malachiteum TaxID=1324776 RepID=UPI0025468F5B|nr:uncharacterized protein N7483_012598 [Penicillium malachiteum]KAJ5715417.1 hypothetical protein N7483_012598 [Penicillium malachiteum]